MLLPVAYALWLFCASISISSLRRGMVVRLLTNIVRSTLLCRWLLLLPLLAACVLPPCACVPVLVYYQPSTLSRLACSMCRTLLLPLLLLPAA